MALELKELEQSIREKMAAEFLTSLTPETKEEILKSAVETSIKEIASSYKLRNMIEERLTIDAGVYLSKYLKNTEVQLKLEEQARKAVDICIGAVIKSIAKDLEHNMKSNYHNFIKPEKDYQS